MIEKNELQKLKEEYPEFFKNTPSELIDFIFADKTAELVADICTKNGVNDENKIEEIAQKIALVILGLSPKENLSSTLREDPGIDRQISGKISIEANRLIFSQIPGLRQPAGQKEPPGEGAQRPPEKPDTYREIVE